MNKRWPTLHVGYIFYYNTLYSCIFRYNMIVFMCNYGIYEYCVDLCDSIIFITMQFER